jgi:glutaminyl-peptide cyclotransferase
MPHLVTLLLLLITLPVTAAPEQLGYRVVDKKPQSRDIFVQGLQIIDDELYVSSGGYGQSRLLRYNFNDGSLELERKVDGRLWAEGLTVLGDRVYLLTWKSRNLLVYNREDLRGVQRMNIPGEGWGLTNNGQDLIYSDGSNRLYFLSLSEHLITHAISVTENGRPVIRLNELEWIDGRIWANVWQTNRIVIINPADGVVEGSIDLQGLLPLPEYQSGTDVLNGIARNPADGGIWVTGKNWPWLYRIEPVPAAGGKEQAAVKVNAEPAADSR